LPKHLYSDVTLNGVLGLIYIAKMTITYLRTKSETCPHVLNAFLAASSTMAASRLPTRRLPDIFSDQKFGSSRYSSTFLAPKLRLMWDLEIT